jgi:hypothetical protein
MGKKHNSQNGANSSGAGDTDIHYPNYIAVNNEASTILVLY